MSRAIPLLIGIALSCVATVAHARDYGQHGAVFPVSETDLLTSIKARLEAMTASGAVDRINQELKERTISKVNRPDPVTGLLSASAMRSWLFDPTITVSEDIKDNEGRLMVPAGTMVNPLDTVPLRQPLIFFDGDDGDERRWALEQRRKGSAKLILVKGAPLALMKSAQTRIYFDQGGKLVRRFGIKATPAIVVQQARQLRVTEVDVARSSKGRQP
jgi:conjugal transfer pilus assembly protein TraW